MVKIGAIVYDEESCWLISLETFFFYSHRMAEDVFFEDHLAMFNEIVANLGTLEVKYDDKYLG